MLRAKKSTTADDYAFEQSKKVYRRLAKMMHPDIHPEAMEIPELSELWERIKEAYLKSNPILLQELEWPAAFIYAGDEYLGYVDVYEHDKEKGIACYEKAIELGEDYGYDCLGEAYFTGTAGTVDYKKAYEYYTTTDEFHSDGKYYYLGEMYFHGYYVEKDFAKAKEYYEGLLCNEVYKDSGSMYVTLAKKRLLEMEE